MRSSRIDSRKGLSLIVAATMLVAAAAVSAQDLPSDLHPESGARLPYPTRGDLGAAGAPVADIFARGDDASTPVTGPLAFASYNPHVGTALLDLHNGAVTEGTLEAAVRELAILVACRATNYTLEWNAHEDAARNAGVSEAVIEVVRAGRSLRGVTERDAAVIRFGRELLDDRDVSASTYAEAVRHFGERGVMDLVGVMMTYAVSGFFAIAVDEHPPGQELLEPLDR